MGTIYFFIFVFTIRTTVFCFNLEDRDPIVKMHDDNGSYFGYSVALHKSGNTSDIRDSWLLVGAPLGQNLQEGTNHSGALFKCPIVNSLDRRDCIQVRTDGLRSNDFEYEDEIEEKAPDPLRPPGNDEIKNNQWLGVNVRSQGPGGKVIVCAHRYIWSENLNLNQNGLGLCYSLSKDLDWEEQWEPCKGRPVLLEHQQFGYCQAGTSLALLQDGTALIGSPGPYTWRGTIFVLSISGDFLSRDKSVYLGPLNDKPEPINKYSYLGMSVAAGKFFYNQNVSYAAGAPRSNDHGQVYIFNKNPPESEMNISLIIDGKQFASNFGYELLAGDFNADGYDDLLVSAPFYFEEEMGGAVYIYYNLRDCNMENCTSDLILRGLLETRFGFSLANLGDINKDGYNDLAVGAPYEGNGAIYIYLGSKDGIVETYSQKIHPGWEAIKTLGYSLSGGIDMDNNGYPDLLAGAYESDAVVLFKTRPIIGIETEITGNESIHIDMIYPGCAVDRNTSDKCFTFQACFVITSAESSVDNTVIKCHIKEVVQRVSRIWFKQDKPDVKHNFQTRYTTLERHTKRYCHNETVYLPKNTRDILSPIKFVINYTIAHNTPDSAILNKTSVSEYKATFKKDCGGDDICQSKLIMDARLVLDEKIETSVLNLGGFDEFQVEINVTNKGDPAYEAKVYVEFSDAVRYIDVVNKTRSFVCKRNNTFVFCHLGNPLRSNESLSLQLRFENKDIANLSTTNELKFLVYVNSTSVELSNKTKTTLSALLSRKAIVKLTTPYHTKTVVYGGEIKGEKAMKTFDDVGSIVWHSYQVQQLGPMLFANLTVDILWPWQVGNDKPQGKWLLYLEDVSIKDGNDIKGNCYVKDPPDAINLLNLTKASVDALPPSLYFNSNESRDSKVPDSTYGMTVENMQVDPFNSWDQQEDHSRRRRSTGEYVVPANTLTGKDGKNRQVITMDCRVKTAKCVTISCDFPKFYKGRQVTILIKSRLWNSTFVEDYSQIDWVRIISYGKISIMDPTIQRDESSQDVMLIETNAYPDLSIQLKSEVPLWIIILAVVAGLLLLLLLIFILWKVGFFKRNRIKDPTLSGNLTKQSEQEILLTK